MAVPSDPSPAPDLVLSSVRLPGEDDSFDVHLRAGAVSAVIPSHRSGGAAPAPSRVVDLEGRYIIPGLWDEHVHMTQWALASNRLDLSAAGSAREAAAVVGSHMGGLNNSGAHIAGSHTAVLGAGPAAPKAVQTLVGVGFRDAVWPDLPSLDLLDDVTRGRPAALISHDLHCVWLNSAAAQRYGVPVDAGGLLREEPAFALTRELGKLPDTVVDPWVQQAGRDAAARGVVGIVDFEMTWNRDAWLRRISGGFASLRVEAGVYPQDLDRAAAEGMRTGLEVAGSRRLLSVGPLKVLIDGSLNTRTAYCVDPYPNGGHGLLTVAEPELLALLVRARHAGFVPAVHAIGDAANRVALDAFEAAGMGGRMEHAQFVRDEDFARFARLGVTASVQPAHALDDRDAAEANWAGRTDRSFPLRSLVAAGAALVLGSDAPVAPLDPWTAMSAATARARQDGRGPWHAEQSLTRQEALMASTRGRGRVRVGDSADIAVLDADPLSASDAEFAAMPVAATLVAGRFTHGGF